MVSALTAGRMALIVAPVRSAATRTGTCSLDRPRLVALPPRLRDLLRLLGIGPPRSFIFPGPRSLAAFQDVGFVGLDDSAQRGRIGLDRPQKAMPPPEGGADRD